MRNEDIPILNNRLQVIQNKLCFERAEDYDLNVNLM
ncbi:hypothetical protein V144x_43740 [Gimesia aquarii]|uniref:Uncharacterized protein n=1 Tax=Gimesia aquarii TaxID=2527964 RepID=A0A517W0T7_9PLAN|nr:hypothetical protein V144x_43740 [Gimesia aquarii]